MASSSSNGASLGAGLVLLVVGSLNVGYGVCLLVHDLEGGPVLTGIGAMLVALATIFVTRAQKQHTKSE